MSDIQSVVTLSFQYPFREPFLYYTLPPGHPFSRPSAPFAIPPDKWYTLSFEPDGAAYTKPLDSGVQVTVSRVCDDTRDTRG